LIVKEEEVPLSVEKLFYEWKQKKKFTKLRGVTNLK